MSRSRAGAALLLAWCLSGCGGSYEPGSDGPGSARALASVYDLLASVPGIVFPQYQAMGLTVDFTLEIDPNGPDAAGRFAGSATIVEVTVGGIVRPFSPSTPLSVTGLVAGSEWSLDSLGPFLVGNVSRGTTVVILSLTGAISPDGRTIQGMALATSHAETGTFDAVRQRRYLVAGTDFGVTGTVSLVRVRYGNRFAVDRDLEAVSGDVVVRITDHTPLAINRLFFDNIQVLDPAAAFDTALQFSTGNGSNPHDAIAVDASRLYITRYEPPFNDILIVERGDGDPISFIDLSPLATNSSGTPRADALVEAGGRIFVTLQNIDSAFIQYGPGRVAVVNPATDQIVRTLTLSGQNPFGPPAVHPDTGDLYIALAGIFQGSLSRALTGGIEVIDPATLTAQGLLVDDDDLGGNISSVAVVRTGAGAGVTGYCIVTLPSGANIVRRFDPATGAIDPGVVYQSASFLPSLVSDGEGYVLVAEHSIADPRLVVLDATTGSVVARLSMSLPAFSIGILTRSIQ